jgi:hypothetical protein
MYDHWYLWLGIVIAMEDPKGFPGNVEQEFQVLWPWSLHSLEQDAIDPAPPDCIPMTIISTLNNICSIIQAEDWWKDTYKHKTFRP